MPRAEYGFAFPIPGPPEYIALLVGTVLGRAALGYAELYRELVLQKKATLWFIPNSGFCLFGTRNFGSVGVKELVFYACEGYNFVKWSRMRMLFALCEKEKCEGIFVHTKNERIRRWLIRWGFMELNNHGDFRWVFGKQRENTFGMTEKEIKDREMTRELELMHDSVVRGEPAD